MKGKTLIRLMLKKQKHQKKTLPSTKLPLESKHILGFPFPRSIRFT